MNRKARSIEHNVKTIAVLGAIVLTSLMVALFFVQRSLGRSIDELSDNVIPIQHQLGDLSDAVANMFLQQNAVGSADLETLNTLQNEAVIEQRARESQRLLHDLLGPENSWSQTHFPAELPSQLETQFEQFMRARTNLFDTAREFSLLTKECSVTNQTIETGLQQLLQQSAAISGILRLNHIIKLRQSAQTFHRGTLSEDELQELIWGDSRMQMETMESFNLAALELKVLAGRIAAASSGDELNSLLANEATQIQSRLSETLRNIERIVSGAEHEDRIRSLKTLSEKLSQSVADPHLDDSLVSRRRQILSQQQGLARIQQNSAIAADKLIACTNQLMHLSERAASQARMSAATTIHGSQMASWLISAVGIVLVIIAALRIRTSVYDLRAQNSRLSELSADLAQVNSGLERAVQQRTAALQLVLDSTGEGIFAVDLDGNLLPERSQVVAKWFGAPCECDLLWDYLGRDNPSFRDELWMGFDQIAADIFPFEVSIAQAPSRLSRQGRTYELDYREVRDGDRLDRVLIVARDVTSQVEAERTERAMKELHHVIATLMNDRRAFEHALNECSELISKVKRCGDPSVSKRLIHTLKGNSALLGYRSFSENVHQLESDLSEDERLPTVDEVGRLETLWENELSQIASLLNSADSEGIRVSTDDYQSLLAMLENHASHQELRSELVTWSYEATSIPLKRIADQATRLAAQTKKNLVVDVQDGGLRLPPEWLQPFWSTMVHVVRNAIDHGLESSEERSELGKPAEGRISLSCSVVNGWLEVRMADDGRGIDWQCVREKAARNGCSVEGEDALIAALFEEGFSTRDVVSDLSGRGVGLGAVRQACKDAGGSVSVSSVLGQGTEFIFRFPWREPTDFDGYKGYHAASSRSATTTPSGCKDSEGLSRTNAMDHWK